MAASNGSKGNRRDAKPSYPILTLGLAVLDLDTSTFMLTYMGAGAPPALLVRAEGSYAEFPSTSPPLGIVSEDQLPALEANDPIPFDSGDVLVLTSPGCVEIDGEEGHEYGEKRLRSFRS